MESVLRANVNKTCQLKKRGWSTGVIVTIKIAWLAKISCTKVLSLDFKKL